MTWQVPGAKVELVEFPGTASEPPLHSVVLEMGDIRRAFDTNTIWALAAALVDAATRCEQRTAHDARARAKAARKELASILDSVRRTGEDPTTAGLGRPELCSGYAAELWD